MTPPARGETARRLGEAAQELFASQGYARTSTREIAERVGVSESLVFRHYGSKANLFQKVVLEPFATFVAEFVSRWERDDAHPIELPARHYVEGMYDLLHEHRRIIVAILAASTFEPELAEGADPPMRQIFSRLERMVAAEAERNGYHGLDIPVTVRATFGLVLSMAVMEGWLFSHGRPPSRKRVVDELVAYILHGTTCRPPPGG